MQDAHLLQGARTQSRATSSPRARWFRLIPPAMVVYIIAFMDRINISYAFSGFGHTFHVGKAAEGMAGGIFFLGYLILQVPGGWIAERWSAKKFVAIMIVFWGLAALACGLVTNLSQLLVARFVLGLAEGGIWPATLVLLSHWFPRRERSVAYSFWMLNMMIAAIITQPISGTIVAHGSWRSLFLIEGALPFLVALPVWLAFVSDRPRDARWCSPEERAAIEAALREDHAHEPQHAPLRRIFTTAKIWRLVVVYFFSTMGFYGLNLWLPNLLKTMTGRGFEVVGLIATLPYFTAIAAMMINGWLADRTGRYDLHVFFPKLLSALTLVASVAVAPFSVPLSILFVCLALGTAICFDGPFWAAASTVLPAAVVGGAMGLINAIGNLGGYFGPSIGGFLLDTTHNFFWTAVFLSCAQFIAGALMLGFRVSR